MWLRLFSARILTGFILLVTLFTGCGPQKDTLIVVPADMTYVSRGKELVEGLGACGVCHGVTGEPGAPLAGGRETYDLYGPLAATNITPSRTGIGTWTDVQILGALRGEWGDDAKDRSPIVHRGYEWLSSNDAYSIVAYLKAQTPVNNDVQRRNVSFIDRNTTGFFEGQRTVTGYVPDAPKKNTVQYGKYLVNHVARCGYCHSTAATLITNEVYLGGNELLGTGEARFAPPLIGGSDTASFWNDAQIIQFLKSGVRPDGSSIADDSCPTQFYRRAPDEDLFAVSQYLRSLS